MQWRKFINFINLVSGTIAQCTVHPVFGTVVWSVTRVGQGEEKRKTQKEHLHRNHRQVGKTCLGNGQYKERAKRRELGPWGKFNGEGCTYPTDYSGICMLIFLL